MRAPTLLLTALAAITLSACSFDVESFQVVSANPTDGAIDVAVGDAGADAARDAPADTTRPDTDGLADVALDGADPIASGCKAKGAPAACLVCCGDGYPKGRSAIVKHANSCFCGATVCATACNATFCKPGAAKNPDDACATCIHDALAGTCSSDIDAARAEEPQVAPYLGCASVCP